MKTSFVVAPMLLSAALAIPAPNYHEIDWSKVDYSGVDWNKIDYSHVDYTKVDWNKVDYSHVDYSKIDWSKVDYTHVDWNKIDWSKVDYSQVDWSKVDYGQPKDAPGYNEPTHPADEESSDEEMKNYWKDLKFTSTYYIKATPDQVVNASNIATGGLPGAVGYYSFAINSHKDLICYHIELQGFRGEYQSPAKTATHIHQADKGKNGPPRLAFPNPQLVKGTKGTRRSVGCLAGPFTTGLNDTAGVDTGSGFRVEQIEQNPANFFADVHSSLAVPGAVRAQLA